MTTSPRILVVDHDPSVVSATARALQADHEVEHVSGGADGLRAIREGGAYDLILCAVTMPDIDGRAFYQWLRREAPLQARRFMFVVDGSEPDADTAELGARVLHASRGVAQRQAVTDALSQCNP